MAATKHLLMLALVTVTLLALITCPTEARSRSMRSYETSRPRKPYKRASYGGYAPGHENNGFPPPRRYRKSGSSSYDDHDDDDEDYTRSRRPRYRSRTKGRPYKFDAKSVAFGPVAKSFVLSKSKYNPIGAKYRDFSGGQCGYTDIYYDFCKHKYAGHYMHPKTYDCYIQCDEWGYAYVKPCAKGTYWAHRSPAAAHYNACVTKKSARTRKKSSYHGHRGSKYYSHRPHHRYSKY